MRKRSIGLIALMFAASAYAQMPGQLYVGGRAVKFSCTGGTKTTNGANTVHTFTSSGSLVCTGSPAKTANILVVAGGASGATGQAGGYCGGGGGAGDYISNSSFNLTSGTYSVTIGAGGAAVAGSVPGTATDGNDGNNTVFGSVTATKGGGGGRSGNLAANAGHTGGSGGGGGGGSSGTPTGGTTSGAGAHNIGGDGTSDNSGHPGSGGGSSAAGSSAIACGTTAGGSGTANSISGSSVTYSSGAGTAADNTAGTAGATPGSGGTGASGGGSSPASGAGANGIVIVSYPT